MCSRGFTPSLAHARHCGNCREVALIAGRVPLTNPLGHDPYSTGESEAMPIPRVCPATVPSQRMHWLNMGLSRDSCPHRRRGRETCAGPPIVARSPDRVALRATRCVIGRSVCRSVGSGDPRRTGAGDLRRTGGPLRGEECACPHTPRLQPARGYSSFVTPGTGTG